MAGAGVGNQSFFMTEMEAGPLLRVNPSLGTYFASGTFRLGHVLSVFSFLTHLQFALYVHPRRSPVSLSQDGTCRPWKQVLSVPWAPGPATGQTHV